MGGKKKKKGKEKDLRGLGTTFLYILRGVFGGAK
jgi:hypothetical protein